MREFVNARAYARSMTQHPAALFTDAGLESHPLGKLGAWGDSGFEYVVMIAALNVGLGLYLVVASSNPAKYWCAIDIFLVCQTLHITSMGVMAFMPSHHMHWAGGVPLGIVVVPVLATVGLPLRSYAVRR